MLLAIIMTGNYIECIWVGTANLRVACNTSGILLIWQISIRAIICSGKYAFVQSSVLANIHWETAYSGKCQWWQMSVRANELRADRLLQSVIVQSSGYRFFGLLDLTLRPQTSLRILLMPLLALQVCFLTLTRQFQVWVVVVLAVVRMDLAVVVGLFPAYLQPL